MPVDLETPYRRLLKEMVTISEGIRNSALDHANTQNFNVFVKFRHHLEIIRTSADTILEAFAQASFTNSTLNDWITDWLTSGELHSCLGKLTEVDNILKPVGQAGRVRAVARLPTPSEDKLIVAMTFFDNHSSTFHFLLTPGVWNCHLPSQVDGVTIMNDHQGNQTAQNSASITAGDEHGNGPFSGTDKAVHKRRFIQQKLNEITRWLAPLDCTIKHKYTLRLRQDGTCKWFPNLDTYKRWRTPGSRFLWLHGKAGCGKSVLISSTIEHLKTKLENEEVIVFFYCDFQNERSTSPTELMRSLLSQLLCHIRDHGVDCGDFADKILQKKSEGALSLDDLDKLCDLVSRAASFFRYEPFVVIDALDECADIGALLPSLVSLSQGDVRLLVTSRPRQVIVDHFSKLQSLSFESVVEETAVDIALHIRQEVDLHDRLRSAEMGMKNEIYMKLTERAEGRFRWVQCQLDTLKRCTAKVELAEALDSLPNELEATYERILGEIDERKLEGALAHRALALLIAAMQPLGLAQLVDGLLMEFKQRNNDLGPQWLSAALLHALSSLVTYHEDTGVLALSHFSVKEYLTSRAALPMYQIVPNEAHAEAAQICMRYITLYLKSETSCGDVASLQSFPMLSYVLSSGFNHLAHVDLESTVVLEALQSLGLDVHHHPSHWQRLCELREEVLGWPYPPWPSSKHDFVLYILVAYCSPKLLRTFLSRGHPLKPRIRTNPLVYAADLRKTEHAMLLLAFGADLNARGLVVDDSYSASPLEVAIDLSEDVLVGELLQKGCLVTPELLATAICMPWCSTPVLARLMATDEFVKWAHGFGLEKLYRSVFNSARPNTGDSRRTDDYHVALAKRLRQIGQDLSAESPFGKELVERALHAAHISMLEFLLPPDHPPPAEFLITASTGDTPETIPVVHFLLQRGIDVHAISDNGDTALHLAAMCPWEPRSLELTRLLIDAGCNPNTSNLEGETPLVIAVRREHCFVVEFLLSRRNVPLPSDILHLALEHRNIRMIELLVYRGADVLAVADTTGDSILHRVILGCKVDDDDSGSGTREERECFDLAKRFIKAGCDPTLCNSNGKTPLEIAINRGFTSVAELLLSCHNVSLPCDILLSVAQRCTTLKTVQLLIHRGADVRSITSDGDTVLHLAINRYNSEETCVDLVKHFIEVGCDPAAHNYKGQTVLEIAIECGYPSVIELLLSYVPTPDTVLVALQRGASLETIQILLCSGADLHLTTSSGDTILHLAVTEQSKSRRLELVQTLLDAGCNPTACNSQGRTVFDAAIERGDSSVIKLLISSNVPLPSNILVVALEQGWTLEMVQFLVRKGADVHSTTSDGETVLHLALRALSELLCLKLVKTFLDAGCDPTILDSRGRTVIDVAIERGDASVVELLISAIIPPPPNILLVALRQGWALEMVHFLIHKGADVHSTTSDGKTVLHLAVTEHSKSRRLELVKTSLKAGCDPTTRDSQGKTVFQVAVEHGRSSVIKLLVSSNVSLPSDVLLVALQRGRTPDLVRYLVHAGADIHSTTSDGKTALHLAAFYNSESARLELVKLLLDAGCDPNIRGSHGKTVLEVAAEHGHCSVIDLLVSSNVPLPSDILLVALQRGWKLDMIQYLVRKGADVHSTTNGKIALHLAVRVHRASKSLELVKTFLEAGCDPSVRDPRGKTVFDFAVQRRHTSVIKLLLSSNVPPPWDNLPEN